MFHSIASFIGILIDIIDKGYNLELSSPIWRSDNECFNPTLSLHQDYFGRYRLWGNPQKLSRTLVLLFLTKVYILFIVMPFSCFMVLAESLLCRTISSSLLPFRVTTNRSISIISAGKMLLIEKYQSDLGLVSLPKSLVSSFVFQSEKYTNNEFSFFSLRIR